MEYEKAISLLIKKINSRNVFIAVRHSPSRLLFEISKRTKKPIIGKCAGTLQELALKLLSDRFENPSIMTDQERLLIVRKTLKDAKSDLWNSPGYIKLIDNRIREFKEHNIYPEKLLEISEKADKKLERKLKESASILKIYNRNIANLKKVDIFSLFEMAKNLKPKYDEIVLFFLPQILPLEIEFLNSLNIPITLITYKTNNSIFTNLNKENLKLLKNWEIVEVKPSQLAKNLSLTPAKIAEKTDISIHSYTGESEGVKKVALTVKSLLCKGISPEKIAVVGRNIENNQLLFYHYFRLFKIPLSFQYEGIPVITHPVIKNFLKSIEESPQNYPLNLWCEKLINLVNTEAEDKNIQKEIEILGREIFNLISDGFLENRELSNEEFLNLFSIMMENRTYIINEVQPFGVFIGSPEAIPESCVEHIIFFDISNGIYPRSFPFDPDFSYREREEINNLLNISNPILEALPGRTKLILYEFQTFFNSIAHKPKTLHFFYDKTKGKSLFISIISKISPIKNQIKEKVITKKAENILKVYRGDKRPSNLSELGVSGWLKKTKGDKKYNFIFSPAFIEKYLPESISVTDIIGYLDCPTEFLFSKIVKSTSPKTAEIMEGQIYHEFINKAYFNRENIEETFNKIFEEITKDAEDKVIFYIKPFIKENALRFIKQFKPEYETVYQEKPIRIKFKNYTFLGRIDWLEISKDGKRIKVVDFKRGNVKNGDYTPGKKKAFQIILYGLALFNNGDVFKTARIIPDIKFSFINVPKFHPKNENSVQEFTVKGNEREIKKTLSWVGTTIKLIKSGFFPPIEIVPQKQKRNTVKLYVNNNYDFFVSKEILDEFTGKIVKKFKEIDKKLWNS